MFNNVKYIFMAGGRANRMGRGVNSVDRTKGLMLIPHGNGTETIIDRTIRLLRSFGSFNESEILFCVGYKKELVIEKYPDAQFLETYDTDDPDDLVPALLRLIETTLEFDNLTVLLADVVWSPKALGHFLKTRNDAPLVLYHGIDIGYSDIFGIGINGEDGKDLIRRVNRKTSLEKINSEVRWKDHNSVPIRYCRASTMEKWIDTNNIPGKKRIYQSGEVDDIDWDQDHEIICRKLKRGYYNK